MPNTFAYLMLALWPVVVAVMFRRMRCERALIWSILGGYLLLPPVANFDVPLLPPLDKHSIPVLSAFLALWAQRGQMPNLVPQSVLARLALTVYLLSGVGTVLTNGDPLVGGTFYLPGIPLTETVVSVFTSFVNVLPLLLAQEILKERAAMRELMLALVVAGLAYSLPMLLEVRLSPQLNVWFYGFFQSIFGQMVRYGGYRPLVFLQHGLWVAFFAFMAVAAAVSLLRSEPGGRGRWFLAVLYLAVVLILCKSAGAIIYMICFAPVVLFIRPRTQVTIAAAIAVIVVLYPMLRGAGYIPTGFFQDLATSIDAERSQSFAFRLANEDLLLNRAAERPVFGWGGWNRNHVLDPSSGLVRTVTDGLWIIEIGARGWVGYLGTFGLLTIPLFLLTLRARSKNALAPYVAPLALILSANLIDLVPNATLIPFSWLMAGALLGYATSKEIAAVPAPIFEDIVAPAPWARPRPPKREPAS